ncbi:unnamed protein product [Plutella xylostella]|uniref:(diamondback moth) hypothetical protein n=1 Tax=Plutella xylostella TaxID=51655 RepID=A0A8S4ESY0_PLUXY|nr:unnamed protein product [Plutella xylostella]
MSLYDDLDTIKARTTEKVAGWSSGIKLLQSQLQLKKAAVTQPKREALRRSHQILTRPYSYLNQHQETVFLIPNLMFVRIVIT